MKIKSILPILLFFGLLVLAGVFWFGWEVIFDDSLRKLEMVNETKKMTSKKIEDNNSESVRLLFLGDVMLDRYNRMLINQHGARWLVEPIVEMFNRQDCVVANLEGVVTSRSSISINTEQDQKEHFFFTFDPDHVREFLDVNGVSLFNLGNNHIMNFGQEGLAETVSFLDGEGIDYFGVPDDLEKSYVIKELDGMKVAFISYSRFEAGFSVEETVGVIKNLENQVDLTIIYAHWGQEYKLVQNRNQEEAAHKFIDVGADLIIGSHPHVVQPIEIYQNKAIFYSLGNFVFDQSFSEDVRTRLAVAVIINDDNLEFKLLPLYLQDNWQLGYLAGEEKKVFLERLVRDSKGDEKLGEGIVEGEFKVIRNP